jgi:hypothetical protein
MTRAEKASWEKISRLSAFGFNQAVTEAGTKNKKAVSAALKIAEKHGLLRKQDDRYIRVSR